MKKILLLGGSPQQVIAIKKAKELGYYTILCDFLEDNPGQYVADKFYLVSTTDKEAIMKVAINEKIDGIIAYASDPAAPTAAYVSEKLNLIGNPFSSVDILCNKDKFRKFLSENDFDVPISKGYTNKIDAIKDINSSFFNFPIIIKPVDSSGSKGITVLKQKKDIDEAIDFAFSFSRGKRILIEEFIEKKHKYLVGGDIFVLDGKIIMWGLMNCHRDNKVNPLVPVGKSYPLEIENNDYKKIKDVLQKLVDRLNIKIGSMNIELVLDKNDRVFLLDVGPRSGGNMIPDLLGNIFDIDIAEMSIKVVMGEKVNPILKESDFYWATYNVHADKSGTFKGIEYSDDIKPYIYKKCIYKKENDLIEYFDNASKVIGIVFMKFDDLSVMKITLNNVKNKIKVKVV